MTDVVVPRTGAAAAPVTASADTREAAAPTEQQFNVVPPNREIVLESTLPTLAALLFAFASGAFIAVVLSSETFLKVPINLWACPWSTEHFAELSLTRRILTSALFALAALLFYVTVNATVWFHFYKPTNQNANNNERWPPIRQKAASIAENCFNIGMPTMVLAVASLVSDPWLVDVTVITLIALVGTFFWKLSIQKREE